MTIGIEKPAKPHIFKALVQSPDGLFHRWWSVWYDGKVYGPGERTTEADDFQGGCMTALLLLAQECA